MKTPKYKWHWATKKNTFSACPKVEAGDWSTDVFAYKVTCERCKNLANCRRALAEWKKKLRDRKR